MYIKYLIFLLFILRNLSLLAETTKFNYKNNENQKTYSTKKYTPTTKINGTLFFTLGTVESPFLKESFQFSYENKIKINSSFNESDKLLTIIESGNAIGTPLNLDLQSNKGDNLKISTLLYQFELAKNLEVTIGPKMFGYNGLAGKSTAYNERFAILDGSNFTTSTGIGPGIGISKRKYNGFNASLKLSSNNTTIDNDSTHFISQVGLTKKKFGGTITSNFNDHFKAYGLAAFYKPRKLPSFSASIEQKKGNSIKTIENWIFALQKNLNNKKFGLAVGTYNEEEEICYEAWSEIDTSDNIKLIPVFFIRENNNQKPDLGFAINTKINY